MRRILLPLLLLPLAALAQTTTYYKISSGTGFVINKDGNILTNDHVVRNCQSISILTPSGEQSAELVANDVKQDLAVLKTRYLSKNVAPLRWNTDSLKVGDPAVVMGYPGKQGVTGHYQFKKTYITSLKGPGGEDRWLQLLSVAEHGNSGGPVLDTNGNVIAVISGMALTYRADKDHKPMGKPVGQADFAITLPALRGFLDANGIRSVESTPETYAYGDGTLRNRAAKFIVPVRCVQDVETR